GDDRADLPDAGDLAVLRAVDAAHVPAVGGVELDADGEARRALQHTAEVELRARRPGVLGAVADPDVGDAPVAHDGVPEVAAAPDQVGFGVRVGRVLRQPAARLAAAAEVD